MRLWDVATGQPLGLPLQSHDGFMLGVAFGPDGKSLAATGNGTVWLWDMSPDSWIRNACWRANRNLSLAEWNQYIGKDIPYEKTCPEFPAGIGTLSK